MPKIAKHLIFQGRVQGVGFRYFCQREALNLGVTGYVRNLINGDVEVVVEGESDQIDTYMKRMKYDHPYAMVVNVNEKDLPFSGDYSKFSIKF